MFILYCDRCGKRIPQEHVEKLGIIQITTEEQYFCSQCAVAELAAESRSQKKSLDNKFKSFIATRAMSSQLSRHKADNKYTSIARHQSYHLPSERDFRQIKKPLAIALTASGAAIVISLIVILLASQYANSIASKSISTKQQDVKQAPSSLAPIKTSLSSETQPTPSITPSTIKPTELPPAELDEQKNRAVPSKTELPNRPPTPSPSVSETLLQSADVSVLRNALVAQGDNAPREAIKRLGELPSPPLVETVVYKADIEQGNLNRWRRDRGSIVTITTEEGEKCLKVEKGNDRLSCYGMVDASINRTRVKLRLFQKGLKKMQLSISCKALLRFNIEFVPPSEGQWQDIVVNVSNATAEGIKIANQPIEHIEVQGFRKTTNNSAYFLLAKIEVINGGS